MAPFSCVSKGRALRRSSVSLVAAVLLLLAALHPTGADAGRPRRHKYPSASPSGRSERGGGGRSEVLFGSNPASEADDQELPCIVDRAAGLDKQRLSVPTKSGRVASVSYFSSIQSALDDCPRRPVSGSMGHSPNMIHIAIADGIYREQLRQPDDVHILIMAAVSEMSNGRWEDMDGELDEILRPASPRTDRPRRPPPPEEASLDVVLEGSRHQLGCNARDQPWNVAVHLRGIHFRGSGPEGGSLLDEARAFASFYMTACVVTDFGLEPAIGLASACAPGAGSKHTWAADILFDYAGGVTYRRDRIASGGDNESSDDANLKHEQARGDRDSAASSRTPAVIITRTRIARCAGLPIHIALLDVHPEPTCWVVNNVVASPPPPPSERGSDGDEPSGGGGTDRKWPSSEGDRQDRGAREEARFEPDGCPAMHTSPKSDGEDGGRRELAQGERERDEPEHGAA